MSDILFLHTAFEVFLHTTDISNLQKRVSGILSKVEQKSGDFQGPVLFLVHNKKEVTIGLLVIP
jgi:hypothetical protein